MSTEIDETATEWYLRMMTEILKEYHKKEMADRTREGLKRMKK